MLNISKDILVKVIGDVRVSLVQVISSETNYRGYLIFVDSISDDSDEEIRYPVCDKINNQLKAEIKFWQVVRQQMILKGV